MSVKCLLLLCKCEHTDWKKGHKIYFYHIVSYNFLWVFMLIIDILHIKATVLEQILMLRLFVQEFKNPGHSMSRAKNKLANKLMYYQFKEIKRGMFLISFRVKNTVINECSINVCMQLCIMLIFKCIVYFCSNSGSAIHLEYVALIFIACVTSCVSTSHANTR